MLQFNCNDYGSQIVEKPCDRVVLATHGVLDFSDPRALSQAWQCIMRFQVGSHSMLTGKVASHSCCRCTCVRCRPAFAATASR